MNELLFSLTKNDFKIEWYSGSGAGGQHRNKHQNCCRITHLETGISSVGTSHKERSLNQKEAFQTLVKRLMPWIKRKAGAVEQEKNRSSESFGGGKYRRTYNEPDNRIKDHVSDKSVPYDKFNTKDLIDKLR